MHNKAYFEKNHIPIILGSGSPRRAELLSQMGFDFSIKIKEINEYFAEDLDPISAMQFVVANKLKAFEAESKNSLIICADTMVAIDGKILGKPQSEQEVREFLKILSNQQHEVITGVGLQFQQEKQQFEEITQVYFKALTQEEIEYYLQNFKPFDKAGAYGIQEWIGHIGVEKIVGSYTNVMGLPTSALFTAYQKFMARF